MNILQDIIVILDMCVVDTLWREMSGFAGQLPKGGMRGSRGDNPVSTNLEKVEFITRISRFYGNLMPP